MKRSALLKILKSHDCQLFREGSRHSIYWNPSNRKTTAVPRHTEISDKLVLKIYKDLALDVCRK
ncbi:MAG: type II toxin-antitoxin system HicA family toxin [Candidatus Wallbacteria bacterium]|nr:type II toxin-antitoxin system HicA family toxin [Candidatus Wallbacteria bacterium]